MATTSTVDSGVEKTGITSLWNIYPTTLMSW
jgi:hypothetical protein